MDEAAYIPADSRGAPGDLYFGPAPRQKRPVWPFLLVASIVFALAIVVFVILAAALWLSSDFLLPGVKIAGIDIGGLSTSEAANRLDQYWQRQSVVVEGEEFEEEIEPFVLGFKPDMSGMIHQAYQQGRSIELLETWLTNSGRITLESRWIYHPEIAESYLATLAPQIEVPAKDAGIEFVNGAAKMTSPAAGKGLDVEATLALIAQNPSQVLTEESLSLVTAPVEPVISDLSSIVSAANQLLANNIVIHAFDPISNEMLNISVPPIVWSDWMALNIEDAINGQFNWSADEQMAESYLLAEVAAFGPGRYIDMAKAITGVVDAIDGNYSDIQLRVFHHDREHIVQAGETLSSIGRIYGVPYPWIQQANPDLSDGLFAGQTIGIPSPDALLPLPVVQNKRIVVSITQQRVWVYEDGQLRWEWAASTGIDESPTAPGIFQIQSHDSNAYASIWDLWMPNFMGVYRPVPTSEFMNGFHGFPTRGGSNLLWTGDLGHQVTYGCILLSSDNAATLYNWADDGIVVEIRA